MSDTIKVTLELTPDERKALNHEFAEPYGHEIRIGILEKLRNAIVPEDHPASQGEEREPDGVALIAAEWVRQVEAEGWTPEHDDQHDDGELARAAAAYALVAGAGVTKLGDQAEHLWPFTDGWKLSQDEVRNLTKAGALIAAEIDRLHRLADSTQKGQSDA